MMNQRTPNYELPTTESSICRDERGSLLVGLIIVMTLMAVMAGGIYQFTRNTSFSELFSNNMSRAYYIAESGGLFAVPQVKADPPGATTNLNGKIYTLPNIGEFSLTIDNSNSSYTFIYSTGVVSKGGWFEAKRQITYKILKTSSDHFNDTANWNLPTNASLKKDGASDNQYALNFKEDNKPFEGSLAALKWDGYGGVANPNAPNLINFRAQSDNLLSYELQVKVKEDVQGTSRGQHYMIGLSFRLDDNGTPTIGTDDTYYGVSFFRSTCDSDVTPFCQNATAPAWLDSLHNNDSNFDAIMSKVTSFDKAFTYSSGSYTEVTTAFGSASTNVQIFAANNDYIYLGQSTPFDTIQVNLLTGASGAGVKPVFEYSAGSGSWTTFTPTDGTSGFRNTGTKYINWSLPFSPLTDWATDTVNGVASKYWIRIQRTQNSLTTVPTENTIKTYTLGSRYIIFWKKVNGVYALLDYKLLTAADNVLNSDGTLKAWSTLVAQVVEQYQTGSVNGKKDDGTGLCATDNNHCLRDNLITVYEQGACTADTFTNQNDVCNSPGTVLYPLQTISWNYSNFKPVSWDWKVPGQTFVVNPDSSQTVTDNNGNMLINNYQALTSAGFSSTREEIGLHGYYDSTSSNDQFLDDFAMGLISSGGGGTGDIQYQ